MKRIFYFGILGFIFFEIANIYFIMPMPGSQTMDSIGLAYFLHKWRWAFRGVSALLAMLGLKQVFCEAKWPPILALLVASGVYYGCNFKMAADAMFLQPKHTELSDLTVNKVAMSRLVLGVEHQGEAKAYPIQFLGYHHCVPDTIGGRPIIVTYCTVCRTGRVFESLVNGQPETFRLVGMDHFNAMFEDRTTRSWWRQVSGEAIAGPLKGQALPEFTSIQTTLEKWSELYPNTLVMQPDASFHKEYDSGANYESGTSEGRLTRRDSGSWQEKSWVVGVETGTASKAYDWNNLQKQHIIHDSIGGQPVVLALSKDSSSFAVLQRVNEAQQFTLEDDILQSGTHRFSLHGRSLQPDVPDLRRARAYQEYWHSWRTFHPLTER